MFKYMNKYMNKKWMQNIDINKHKYLNRNTISDHREGHAHHLQPVFTGAM